MLAPVDEPLIAALRLGARCRIAELGSGGGATALEIHRRAPPGSVVHGFDISAALVEEARGRAPRDGPAFEVVDVATAPAPQVPYDRLVSRFGVLFFDDPLAAFRNLRRWIAPQGRFAFAVWGPPADNPWFMTVREVVAAIVELPPSDPEGPGPFRYTDDNMLQGLVERAGFTGVETHEWRGKLPVGGGLSAPDAARFALAAFATFAAALTEAGEDAVAQAQRSLTERLSGHLRDGSVQMDARVHIFTGTGEKT